MTISSKKLFLNKRKEPRYPYSGQVLFVYKKSLNEARLSNWSRSGLCLKTKRFFSKGAVITVSLPPSKFRDKYRRAIIVWRSAESCGVQFCD
jgi:hypothetical protein